MRLRPPFSHPSGPRSFGALAFLSPRSSATCSFLWCISQLCCVASPHLQRGLKRHTSIVPQVLWVGSPACPPTGPPAQGPTSCTPSISQDHHRARLDRQLHFRQMPAGTRPRHSETLSPRQWTGISEELGEIARQLTFHSPRSAPSGATRPAPGPHPAPTPATHYQKDLEAS